MPLTDQQRDWIRTKIRMREAEQAGAPYAGPIDPDMPPDVPDHEPTEQEQDAARWEHAKEVARQDRPLQKTPIDEAAEGLIAGAVAGPALAAGRAVVAGAGMAAAGRVAVTQGVVPALEGSLTSPGKDILKATAKDWAKEAYERDEARLDAARRQFDAERAVPAGEQAAVAPGAPGPDEDPRQGGYTGIAPGSGRSGPVGYSGNSPPEYAGTDVEQEAAPPLPVPWIVPPPEPPPAAAEPAPPLMSMEPPPEPPPMSIEPAPPPEPPQMSVESPPEPPPPEPPPMSIEPAPPPPPEPPAMSVEPPPEPPPPEPPPMSVEPPPPEPK